MSVYEGEELTQQDANTEESSEPQKQSADSENTGLPALESKEPAEQSEKPQPFHEHPRFKEVIESNRSYKTQLEQYEAKTAELERKYDEMVRAQAPKPTEHPFKAKLREIDPAYAEYLESLEGKASSVDEVKQELQQLKYERLVTQYEGEVSRAQNEAKTTPEVHGFIKSQLDAMARAGQVQMRDVPAKYKELASNFNTLLDSVKRAERASYVADKSKDAASPATQPKGKAPSRNDKGQFTGDREHDLALITKRVMKISKAESDI